ncbi:hypothetical protein GCM10018793_18440 [Streptomyces sulfonofaciens]|uniref:Uncharacterized protein n=1 Tax=Streptomyces sulfonofaciens TaxID=68272 RepID=A0A919FZF2_9ACTN|nr:hypothetical protein [Streptomyces sulfonofaciens]GHH75347.1 hypothetical protein GCM10018793_18440 [Streptomyces sulfonofaciens]
MANSAAAPTGSADGTGNWDAPSCWAGVLFRPALALLLTLVALALPKTPGGLRADAQGVAAVTGRHRRACAWPDVEAVRVRQVRGRGLGRRAYGPHVRLRPGAPGPPRAFRGRAGRHLVLPAGLRRAVPPDIAAAFVRFSQGRRQG